MAKKQTLEDKLLALKTGEVLKVDTAKERAEAYRIAIRGGFDIITRSCLLGKGFEIVKN